MAMCCNGYVLQWQKKNPDEKTADRILYREAICHSPEHLVDLIAEAAKDIETLKG